MPRGYQPLEVDSPPGPDAHRSQLRFSQTIEPTYIHNTDVLRSSGGRIPDHSTPLESFNAATYEERPPIRRRGKASKLIFCLVAMACTALIAAAIIVAIGLGIHYKCENPKYSKTQTFTTNLGRVERLNIDAINAFLEFTSANDDKASDIVIVVRTGAPSQEEFDSIGVNFVQSGTTFNLTVGGDRSLNIDDFMAHCLVTTIRVIAPPSHYIDGTLHVNIVNGKISVENLSGWRRGHFTMSSGTVELEDIANATSTAVELGKGTLQMDSIDSDVIQVSVGRVSASLSKLASNDISLALTDSATVTFSSPLLRNDDSQLRAMESRSLTKSSLKLSGLAHGQVELNLPSTKTSIGVSRAFCGFFDLTAQEFEMEGSGIRENKQNSTSSRKMGQLGGCDDGDSSLTSVSRGKVKLVVK